jgi:hypothetical protein
MLPQPLRYAQPQQVCLHGTKILRLKHQACDIDDPNSMLRWLEVLAGVLPDQQSAACNLCLLTDQ